MGRWGCACGCCSYINAVLRLAAQLDPMLLHTGSLQQISLAMSQCRRGVHMQPQLTHARKSGADCGRATWAMPHRPSAAHQELDQPLRAT